MADKHDSEDDQDRSGFSWRDLPDFLEAIVATVRGVWFLVRGLWWLAGLIAKAIRN